jgi:hypothetical protein
VAQKRSRWHGPHGGTLKSGDAARIWILELLDHYQVTVKSFIESEVKGEFRLSCNDFPKPMNRHCSQSRLGPPGQEPLTITGP